MKNHKRIKRVVLIFAAVLFSVSVVLVCFSEYKLSTQGAVKLCDYGCVYDDFKVVDDKVFFSCRVTLENTSDKSVKYMIVADLTSDSISGLITEPLLIGFSDEKLENNIFEIGPNEITEVMNVVFAAPHGTKDYKLTRNMPDLKIIEL